MEVDIEIISNRKLVLRLYQTVRLDDTSFVSYTFELKP
ncbi:unnamed protein product, partial [Rotaria magnacalcarata]